MKISKKHVPIIIVAAIALILFGMQETLPKEAIADVHGQACVEMADCPCWGDMGDGEFGLGVSTCSDGTCDTTFCFDVQPVKDWARDNPIQWVKDNILIALGLLVLVLVVVFWPKV